MSLAEPMAVRNALLELHFGIQLHHARTAPLRCVEARVRAPTRLGVKAKALVNGSQAMRDSPRRPSEAAPDYDAPSRVAVPSVGDHVPSQLLPGHLPACFGCGADNPAGLRLEVWRAGDEIFTDVVFDERHTGGPGLAHGGAIATACDDFLGYTVWLIGAPAVTRVLTVDFLKPVRLDDSHRLRKDR